MKKILLCFYLISFLCVSGFNQNIAIFGGVNYGGPIPVSISDSSSGKPIPGVNFGFSYLFKLSDRLSLMPEIYYSFKGADYSQSFTKDTTVSITIFGMPGQVPSFYTAYVNGNMRLHYIDIPLLFNYRVGKSKLMLGPYFSFLCSGKDKGNVRVVVGEGGFYDDYNESYNNFQNIRKMESGVIAGFNMPLYKGLFIELKASRSLASLYIPEAMTRGNGTNKLFNTFMHLSLGYNFL